MRAEFLAESVDDRLDVGQVAVLDGEADVGGVVVHHVLDDVVDDDVGRGDVAEDLGGDAGPIGHVLDGDADQVLLQGRARYDDVFHVRSLRDDPGAFGLSFWLLRTCKRHVVLLGKLHRPRLQHRCAQAGQLEHFVVADAVDLARVFHDPRVGGVDAVDVGVVLADVGLEHRAEGDQRRIAAAAAQRGEIALGRDALEAGDDDDLARRRAARRSAAC